MADKTISELLAANQVTPTDLFVLEQSGIAKKLSGQTLEDWLLSLAGTDFVALASGTAIAKNTDLDTVTAFGNYKCTGSATAKTLLHCPVDIPFIMRVGSPAPGVANYFYQEIISLYGVRYYRYGAPSSGVLKWNDWRQTFATNAIIPARYGGMGANISSDWGEVAHTDAVQKFIDKMNEMAVQFGMINTVYKTPTGLCSKPINFNKAEAEFSTAYNSYTTAYDLLRLMVAVRHTPTVYTAMGCELYPYFINGKAAAPMPHSNLSLEVWKDWAKGNGYTIRAIKGGSLDGEFSELGGNPIMNYVFIIESNGNTYAVAVVGLVNNDYTTLRTLVEDLIDMANGGAETEAIREANSRTYPVGMAVAKLTGGCFDDDMAALENGVYYNGHTVYVMASLAKVMTALVAFVRMGNHECSVNYDDLVGGSSPANFKAGDTTSAVDALSLILAVSDNTLATMLARICGEKIIEAGSGGGGSGEAGADGFSPIVKVTQTATGATISITDKDGETTATIANGKDGADGYTPVKGVDYWTDDDKQEMVAATENAIIDEYGAMFDAFPTEVQIQALPNKSFFTVHGYGKEPATYYKTNSWASNAMRYKDTNGSTLYVVPISQPVGEIYLPYYGIKTGEENAESNSAIMDTLLTYADYGTTFRFPVGHFYFSKPIDISEKHISIIGTTIAGYRHKNILGTTFLHFTNVTSGQIALKVGQCTIADFTVYGNESQYSVTLDRDEDSTVPSPKVNVTGNVKNYGIWASAQMIIRNVGVRNFYYGMWCDTANMMITDVTFNHCHYGLSIGNDIKCFNVFGFNVMVLLQMRGSLASATGVRGDSVGEHLVEITGGGNHTLTDLDADFCMGAIVAIGDGVTASNVINLNINGIHGRNGVSHVHATSATEITAQNITADNAGEFGVLAVETGSSLRGAVIITNQSRGSNPYDSVAGFRTPFVLLSAGGATTVQGVQMFTTASNGDEMTEAWVKKRIASCSGLADACTVKVYTANGTINYSRSNGAVIVTDDATDIYNRMDKSALARKDEIILTVNGIEPDVNGNVEITEQEPEVVGSIDECTDHSKKYVLPDGYIYAYRKRFIPGGTTPNFTNRLPLALNPLNKNEILAGVGYKSGVRYAQSNGVYVENTTSDPGYSVGLLPVKSGDVVRINALGYHTTAGQGTPFLNLRQASDLTKAGSLWSGNLASITDGGGKYVTSGTYERGMLSDVEICINNGTFGWVVPTSGINDYYINLFVYNTTPPDSVIITVNEEITYTVTEDRYEWSWTNTGEPYVKPDYLAMIADLQRQIDELKNA